MPIGKMIIQIVDRETKDLHEMGGGSHFDIPSGYLTVRHGKIHHV